MLISAKIISVDKNQWIYLYNILHTTILGSFMLIPLVHQEKSKIMTFFDQSGKGGVKTMTSQMDMWVVTKNLFYFVVSPGKF